MTTDWRTKVEWAVSQIRLHSPATRGCSAAELAEFQQQRRVELPEAYCGYLLSVGADPGEFLRGTDLGFEQLDALQSTAQAILDDDQGPSLPSNAFVFCAHQGYQFLFFHLGDGPDPAVHHYLEGDGEPKMVAPAFSDWLVGAVHDEFPAVSPREPDDR